MLLASLVAGGLLFQSPAPSRLPADSLHVEASGSGPTVVLVPGLFGAAYGFRQLVPLLTASGHRVVIIEPLGVGWSSRPPKADYSLAAQADRIAAVLDTLHAGPVVLVAHSLGGAIAFRIAVRHPSAVRGLLSLEGGPTEEATTPVFRRALKFAPIIQVFGMGASLLRGKVKGMMMASSGDQSWITDEVVRGYTAGAVKSMGATIKAFQQMARAREPEALAPRLHEIRVPVRLVVGGSPHDGSVGDDEVRLLTRSLPTFAIDSAPGVGHFIQEERPAAVLASLRRLEASISSSGHEETTVNAHANRANR